MKDCTTCKYGYEDEQMGFPMCHHPKRFSVDCVDFNMHEEKESEHLANPGKTSPKDLEEAAEKSLRLAGFHNMETRGMDWKGGFIAGAEWGAERFAKIVRANLTKIDKSVQSQFEQLYMDLTGDKMYGGYND